MARYCRALDPKRLKLTEQNKRERTIKAALDEVARELNGAHNLVCTCPEAAEGEHECSVIIYRDELEEKAKTKAQALEWCIGN